MAIETWLLFCATEFFLSLNPGPAVMLVCGLALAHAPRAALPAALGILAANTLYFVLSASGLAAAAQTSPDLFTALRWCGALYLIVLGTRALLGPVKRKQDVGQPDPRQRQRDFARGFLVQASNPRALIYFSAILPQFVRPDDRQGIQFAVLGLTSVVVEFAVLAGYAAAAWHAGRFAGRTRLTVGAQRAGGLLLIAAGLGLGRAVADH